MHAATVTVLVATAAFFGTTIDNAVLFAVQLSLTDKSRFKPVCIAKFSALLVIIAITATVAVVLTAVPLHWIAVLAAVPIALAWHAWRHRKDPARVNRRGATTTFLSTIAVGGDNLAVWIPLFRAFGTAQMLLAAGVFAFWDLSEIALTRQLASHPRVLSFGQRWAPSLTPPLYVALAGVVIWRCGW